MVSARLRNGLVAGLVGLVALAGCATAPPERFYSLSSGLPAADGARAAQARTVVVAPAAMPDLVDRPQLVLHTGEHEVAILEQQRWAEPLRTSVPRVVAENLARLHGDLRVSTRDDAIGTPDCRVSLDIRRFQYSRAASNVTVEALWTVSCADTEPRTGRSVAREIVADPSVDAIVRAQGRALGPVSRDIARVLLAGTTSSAP
jgi:uncharacterized protein